MENMRKYTIIYVDSYLVGSHMSHMVMKEVVETDDIKKVCHEEFGGMVHFVFEGEPKNLLEDF